VPPAAASLTQVAPADLDHKELSVTARSIIPFVFLLALLACGCGARPSARQETPSSPRPPAMYTVGRALFGVRGHARLRLRAAPVAPLAGWLSPAAVPSPDGRYVAYNAWHELREDDPALSWEDQGIEAGDKLARPSIRLYDVERASDQRLVDGGFSVAWRADGALAYFRGAARAYRAGVPYVGDVFARPSGSGAPVRWTSRSGRYVVAGWAGSTLLAYRERAGEALDLLALDRAGRARTLSPDAGLVAISPDGSRALVEHGPKQGPPSLAVLRVADGRRLASLDLTRVDPAVGLVGYAGDWEGDRAVAPSSSGGAVFRIGQGRIALLRVIRAATSVTEPRFASGGRVTAWTTTPSGGAFLDCGSVSARCSRVQPLPAARGDQGYPTWRRPVYNPSRPQGGER
jgi:hypothetical protein